MKLIIAGIALLWALAGSAVAQSSNGSIGGTVQDPTAALIPGVTMTATNTQTGIVTTTITNETGAYNFASLLPGSYTVSAELPGFRTQVYNEVLLGGAAQVRLNFTLEVGGVAQAVEVSVAADSLVVESSSSIASVLSERTIRQLPIVGNDVLSLISTMPGVVGDSFAGVQQMNVNTTRDGLPVADQRFNNGVFATTLVNPDLVGEVRIILAPVDAELGRGNGQVQILSRSGTNTLSGSAVWYARNSAFNSNTWSNNKNIDPRTLAWSPTTPNWVNNHEYTLSAGGPIVKNKTFFYTLWDQQINYQRILQSGIVLTDTARQGIFRYWEGFNPGMSETIETTGTNPTTAAVDATGRPIAPLYAPRSTAASTLAPYTGGLRCFSVFGNRKVDGSAFTQADCPGGLALFPAAGTAWDTIRLNPDSTGYIRRLLERMPQPNYFAGTSTSSDGLNLARHRWILRRQGNSGAAVTTGTDADTNRKQLNLNIDHNFNGRNKISGRWSIEANGTDSDVPLWPDGLAYRTIRNPQTFTANFTSTLSPSLLNEARFGARYNNTNISTPWELERSREEAQNFAIAGQTSTSYAAGKDYFALISPGGCTLAGTACSAGPNNYVFNSSLTGGLYNTNPTQYSGNKQYTFNYTDNLSWTRGKHAFKFGGEFRTNQANGFNNQPLFPFERIIGGGGAFPSPLANPLTALPNRPATAQGSSANMLYLFAGSIAEAQMLYWIDGEKNVTNGTWEDVQTRVADGGRRYRDQRSQEWNGFFKDDWKITTDLTLNVGVRYDYFGSPYIRGLSSTPVGQGDGMFGALQGGNPFEQWLTPGSMFLTGYGSNVSPANALQCAPPACGPAKLTTLEFVGPGTSHPDKRVIPADRNNFGPAVGFAWQLPWFGAGKTTVRGGYQITYGGNFGGASLSAGGGGNTLDAVLGTSPGATSTAQLSLYNEYSTQYYDLSRVNEITPVIPTSPTKPGGQIAPYAHAGAVFAFDARYVTPYTQNFTLALSRTLGRNTTVDLRYIGTSSKKQRGVINLNQANVFHNPELFLALDAARRGEDPALLDQMLAGLNLNTGIAGYGPVGTAVNGVLQTGAAHLRRNATFAGNLANGNFAAIASSLASSNGTTTSGLQALPAGLTASVQGRLLRNGCDRLANGITTVGPNNPTALRCLPENYIVANPQLANAGASNGAFYNTNDLSSSYHSMQAQLSMRNIHGATYTMTYTWSKDLGLPAANANGTSYTDPTDRRPDYGYTTSHRAHDFRGNGTFDLPIGPGKSLLRNSSGLLAKLVERWQMGAIFTMSSGPRADITATGGLYANAVPDIVGALPSLKGKIRWNAANNAAGNSHGGTYFDNPSSFVRVTDPQCLGVTTRDGATAAGLRGNCTLNALALLNPDGTTGPIVLQNPKPGTRGNLGQGVVELPGTYRFDATMSKSFQLTEKKSATVRIDVTNVLNHPDPGTPNLSLNTTTSPFGDIAAKGPQVRAFQAQLRFSF